MENPTTTSDVNPADYNLIDFTFTWLPHVSLVFLSFNSSIAIYQSGGDFWSIVSVLVSVVTLVFLAFTFGIFALPACDSSLRGKLKAAVWILTTLLTIMFLYPNGVVPPAIAITAWSMAVATILGGYYEFYIYKESDCHTSMVPKKTGLA
ncbi:hypothetical protein LUZ61_005591 [Rhynchospora tenuis]|uniref:Uncharacterized protein n=1 Tax=Rhynchospora tenuis TaxID=198213 RepID=A0AAD5ZQ25_9POAL|nr:hypothetical protein LUZ61_005591 [Rhynchospora tenuis]